MIDVLRTDECLKRFREKRKKLGKGVSTFNLLSLPHLKEWNYWVLIKNEFPYDKIASKHDMLVPTRFFEKEREMEDTEIHELLDIKDEISDNYNFFLENTKWGKSIPLQFHLHCIKLHFTTVVNKEN